MDFTRSAAVTIELLKWCFFVSFHLLYRSCPPAISCFDCSQHLLDSIEFLFFYEHEFSRILLILAKVIENTHKIENKNLLTIRYWFPIISIAFEPQVGFIFHERIPNRINVYFNIKMIHHRICHVDDIISEDIHYHYGIMNWNVSNGTCFQRKKNHTVEVWRWWSFP